LEPNGLPPKGFELELKGFEFELYTVFTVTFPAPPKGFSGLKFDYFVKLVGFIGKLPLPVEAFPPPSGLEEAIFRPPLPTGLGGPVNALVEFLFW
jgi:hypothetical protein